MPTVSGSGPGQDLSEVVNRFNYTALQAVLGTDVVALIDAVTDPSDRMPTLRRVAVNAFRNQPNELMHRPDIRQMCLHATSAAKLNELAARLAVPDMDTLLTIDLSQDSTSWQAFVGFYGLDSHGAASSTLPLAQEVVLPQYGLFPHQRSVANRAYEIIRHGHGRVVLHMPTGTGKTRTAMHIVSRFLTAAEPCVLVWLAASSELLEQAADAFQSAWMQLGNRALQMVRFWGKYTAFPGELSDGILVAGLQTMHSLRTRNPIDVLRLGASARLVVIDEAHQAIAKTYQEVINALANTGPNTALLGLTATPGRTWSDVDADKRLSSFFGERKVMVEIDGRDDPVSFLVEQGYMARPTFSRLEVQANPKFRARLRRAGAGGEYDENVMEALATDVSRNIVILEELRRLVADGHTRIMFFAASVRHARIMVSALSAVRIEARLVSADTDFATRRRVIRAFRASSAKPMALCNFGVLTAGFDAPNTSACVIARPTKSLVLFSQMVGRATRGPKAGGNATCAVSTVVDVDLPGFGDLAEAFTNWEDVWHDRR